jgi:Kef-type K+ transport system membrane component KefB
MGLFFIAVGMSDRLRLLGAQPGFVALLILGFQPSRR